MHFMPPQKCMSTSFQGASTWNTRITASTSNVRYRCTWQQKCPHSKGHPSLLHRQTVMLEPRYVVLAMNHNASHIGRIRSCGLSLAWYQSRLSKLGGYEFVLRSVKRDILMTPERRYRIKTNLGQSMILNAPLTSNFLLIDINIRTHFLHSRSTI